MNHRPFSCAQNLRTLQVEHYALVLPAVFAIMADPDPLVQERACYALDTFCEGMERENILPFMPQVCVMGVGVCLLCACVCQRKSCFYAAITLSLQLIES